MMTRRGLNGGMTVYDPDRRRAVETAAVEEAARPAEDTYHCHYCESCGRPFAECYRTPCNKAGRCPECLR